MKLKDALAQYSAAAGRSVHATRAIVSPSPFGCGCAALYRSESAWGHPEEALQLAARHGYKALGDQIAPILCSIRKATQAE